MRRAREQAFSPECWLVVSSRVSEHAGPETLLSMRTLVIHASRCWHETVRRSRLAVIQPRTARTGLPCVLQAIFNNSSMIYIIVFQPWARSWHAPPPMLDHPIPCAQPPTCTEQATIHAPNTTADSAGTTVSPGGGGGGGVLATSPAATSDGGPKRNSYARVLGSATAGVSELLLFHPVDTVAKRLMSNQTVAVKGQPVAEAKAALNKVPVHVCVCVQDLRERLCVNLVQ